MSMPIKKLLRPGVSSATFAIIFAMMAGPAVAIENGGIGGRPTNPRPDNPRTESIFMYTINPGARQPDGVTVINNSNEAKNLLVYATDASESADRTFACKQFGEERKDVGSWIDLTQEEVTLQPGENRVVNFTLTVPANASPGEHNGCIAIQERPAQNENPGVRLSLRTALRVAVTVPGDLRRDIEIVSNGFNQRDQGDYLAFANIKNKGNVSSDTNVEVIIKDLFGREYEKFGGEYAIFAGEEAKYSFQVSKPFWGGLYRNHASATYNKPLNPDGSQTEKTSVSKVSGYYVMMPQTAGLLIELSILALLLGLLGLLLRQRRRKRHIAATWVPYEVQKGDDVHTIAERYDTSWRVLARANNLKAPYTLESGQEIVVPPLPGRDASSGTGSSRRKSS